MEMGSFSSFKVRWQGTVAFLKQLGSLELALIAIIALAYGVFAEPTLRGFLSYQFQWFLKSCGFIVCVLACMRYVAIAKREQVVRLQWPVKFVLASLVALVTAAAGWFLLWLLIDGDSGSSLLAGAQILGVLVMLAFILAWGAIGDIFKAGRQDRVLYAGSIALAVQVVVAVLAYIYATRPDAFADVGAPALGAVVVAIYTGAALVPLAAGLLVFQCALFFAWVMGRSGDAVASSP